MQWLGIILVLFGLLLNTFGGRFRRKAAAVSL
jgi:DME family drug/metabolite transporter/O-acetylserine/cysteine efflux transporter